MKRLILATIILAMMLSAIGTALANSAYDKMWREIYESQLIDAARAGKIDDVSALLTKGVDVNAKDFQDCTALGQAAYHGHVDILRLLLDRGADVNKLTLKSTPLMLAARQDKIEVVRLLLDRGADMGTALTEASINGYTEIALLLLDRGANINAKDKDGNTALMWAAGKGKTEIVRLLLDRGADVHAKTITGTTAMSWADDNNYYSIIKMLKEAGSKGPAVYSIGPPLVDDFAGVAWGTSSDQVEREMAVKGLVRSRANLNTPNQTMDYYRGSFDGRPALLAFIFKNDSLYSGWADFSDVLASKRNFSTRYYYITLVNEYKDKFGPPTSEPEDDYDAKNVWVYGNTRWDNLTSSDSTLKEQVNITTSLRSDGKMHVTYSAELK